MKLYDTTQFKQTYRRIPPVMIDEVTTHIQELIAIGVCCVPHSPFSSKKVLFRKQDELLRLSELTVVNLIQGRLRITMPPKTLISDLRLSLYLSLATYFFLCIKSGYFQIEIEESQGQNCVYSGDTWILRVQQIGFGLANAPATYQRLQQKCLRHLHLKICYIYLDNLVIFSTTIRSIQID